SPLAGASPVWRNLAKADFADARVRPGEDPDAGRPPLADLVGLADPVLAAAGVVQHLPVVGGDQVSAAELRIDERDGLAEVGSRPRDDDPVGRLRERGG